MSNKPKWLQHLADFLIDNLTIILTIGFAGFVIYRREIAQIAVSTDELITAVLGVLGLLATSEIVERYRRLNSIEKSSKRILGLLENRFADRPSAIAFFQEMPNISAYFQSANEISLCGVTLTSTMNKQITNLRERLKAGANIRVLIADPDSQALEMSSARSDAGEAHYYHHRLESTFQEIEYLIKSWKRSQEQPGNLSKPGNFSVRLTSYAPSFSILAFDVNQSNGTVFVEIYPHKNPDKTPTFVLNPQRDGEWYWLFADQFERMWQVAKPWDLETISST